MHEKALSRALKRPNVAAHLEVLQAQEALAADTLKKRARSMAIRAGIDLLQHAASEQVRARMVEFFAAEPKERALVQINQAFGSGPAPVGYAYPGHLVSGGSTDAQSGDVEGSGPSLLEDQSQSCVIRPTQEVEEAQLVPPEEGS